MNNSTDGGGMLGRLMALALILGAAYGVHSISRGGLGCPLGRGSCCALAIPHEQAGDAEQSAPATSDAGRIDEADDATLEKKAPVAPAKAE